MLKSKIKVQWFTNPILTQGPLLGDKLTTALFNWHAILLELNQCEPYKMGQPRKKRVIASPQIVTICSKNIVGADFPEILITFTESSEKQQSGTSRSSGV